MKHEPSQPGTTQDWRNAPDTRAEEIAEILWHRFAPSSHMEWDEETHKAEYLQAAQEAIKIACKPVTVERVPFVIEDRS